MEKYKIFKITYNDGKWHSGSLPTALFIARSEEEVRENSKAYKEFNERKGDIWITDLCDTSLYKDIENINDFIIEVKPK